MSGGRSPDVNNRIYRGTKNKHSADGLDESGLTLEPISKSAFLKRKNKCIERNDRSKTVKRKCITGNECNSSIVNKEKILHRKKSLANQNNLEDTVITCEQFQSVLCNRNAKEDTVINKTGTEINNSIVNNPQHSLKDTLNYNLKQLACLSQEIKDIQSVKQLSKVPASEITSLPNSFKGIIDTVNTSIDSNKIVTCSKLCAQISPKRSFSPLPSTSTDNTIFEVNNRNFLHSLENEACSVEAAIVSNEYSPKSINFEGSETDTQVVENGEQLPANIETFHNMNKQKHPQNSVITDVAIRSSDNSVCPVLDMISLTDSQNDSVEIVIEDSILSNYNSSQDRIASTVSNSIIVIDDDDEGDLPNVTGLRQSTRLLGTFKKSLNGVRAVAPKKNIVETVDLVDISESLALVPNQMRGCSIVVDSNNFTSSPATSVVTTQCSPDDSKVCQVSVKKPSPQKNLKSGECVICFEIFGCRPLASTLCGHIFCQDCLDTAMKNSKKCPTCRKPIKKNGFHPIFF